MKSERYIDNVLLTKALANKGEINETLSLLRREKVNKPVIYVGAGTCGLGAGAGKTLNSIKEYVETKSIDAEVLEVGCIGLCAAEPIVDIQIPGHNRVSFSKVTEEKVDDLLDSMFKLEMPVKNEPLYQFNTENGHSWENIVDFENHPYFSKQKRIVLQNCGSINPVNIDEYIARGGYSSFLSTIANHKSPEVCDMVEQSGLRGRGGGGFTTGMKWKFALNTPSEQKYLICNADEGDPGAFMDRAIIEGDPHRLIEGMMIAAYGIGATKSYIYIRAEYPLAIERLNKALDQAKEYGLLGTDIFGSGINFDIKVKMGAGAFVCGEETALIASVEGQRGMPRKRPPFPAASGLWEKPTNINNVETLANIPWIVLNGSSNYAKYGTEKSKGTKVFALAGKINRSGLAEVPMGMSIRDVIFKVGGGIQNDKKFKAVQMGGPSGGCIPESLIDTIVDYDSVNATGAIMGSGGMVVMDEDTCMIDVAKFFLDFTEKESCGKCTFCRIGTKRMLEILNRITEGEGAEGDIERLEELAYQIKDSSLCGLGQTAPNPVLTTIKYFRHEYEAHINDKKCPAKACTKLLTYEIIPDMCTGCTVCAKKCPTDAIDGERKEVHFIREEDCIQCGTCLVKCKFDAIRVY